MLEARELRTEERKRALNYTPGDVVVIRKGVPKHSVAAGTGYTVAAIDGRTVQLTDPKGKAIDWKPASWGATFAKAFTEVDAEFRTGDRVQFTRNDYRADRRNSMVATVLAVDPAHAGITVAMPDGTEQALDVRRLAHRYVRPGWVQTVHAAQGATATRARPHGELPPHRPRQEPLRRALPRPRHRVPLHRRSR
ncbi:hypothetical protein [Sphingomonas sp. RIT328]|uniref:hypothetical protein n=1 Tax=Sphingomonas sp. RIT328 TaxID=1470591 RepID=UPI0004489FDB|nr:hypothetical protein [Sphingomonas sp. RIT328]EZP56493.1 TrwC protein [Sphingomonas sp. RIT328]